MSIPAEQDRTAKPASGLAHTIKQPIVFDGTATPVKTALFVIICAAWLLPGLIGHDPWKPDDAQAFGVVYSMLHSLSGREWLIPTIAGVPHFDYPPLYYWVSAACAWLFSWLLPLHDGARLASGAFMALTLYYLHKTANRLFDDRAGRIAVLLLIGSLGLLLRAHETNPELAGMAGFAIALYGMTRIRSEPRKGGITTGVGAGVMALSIGIVPVLVVPVTLVALLTFARDWGNRDFRRGVRIAFSVMVPLMLTYPLALVALGYVSTTSDPHWLTDTVLGSPLLSSDARTRISVTYWPQILPWYALPSLPFALWLWWKDRSKLRERIELALPLVAFLSVLIMFSLTREARDATGLTMLIPLALAAASVLDRLPREVARIMDGFGLIFFGLTAFLLWTTWTSALTGLPRNFARWVGQQAPGFDLTFSWLTFALALALTLIWAYAVIRAHRNNRRAVVNWAAGITLVWVLINLLGLPAVDHVRSYRGVANSIASVVNANASAAAPCLITFGLGDAQRASLEYFGKFQFTRPNEKTAPTCAWAIEQMTNDGAEHAASKLDGNWNKVWEGARPGEKNERLRLHLRQK